MAGLEWNIQEGVEPAGQEKGWGEEKSPGAQEHSAQLAGGRQSRQLYGLAPAEGGVRLRMAGAGDFLSSWGQFSLPTEMGREKCQGCNGCLRTPSFLELSIAWGFSGFLQENDCIDSKEENSSGRAANSQNPIPSEKHGFGVSFSLLFRDPYISGGCCHQSEYKLLVLSTPHPGAGRG